MPADHGVEEARVERVARADGLVDAGGVDGDGRLLDGGASVADRYPVWPALDRDDPRARGVRASDLPSEAGRFEQHCGL